MRRVWLLGLILAGCSDDGDGDDEVAPLARRAAEVRELDLDMDIPIVEMTPEEFAAKAASDVAAIDDAELRELADTYGRLGFFPVDLDLRPGLATSRTFAVGTYSPSQKLITLVGMVADDTLVHEYVHGLQDQHFDLTAYDGETSDAFLARRAVVEGDAVLAQSRFYAEENFGDDGLFLIDWGGLFDSYLNYSEQVLDDASFPLMFGAYASFTYGRGLPYCAENLLGINSANLRPFRPPHDWRLEDELFTQRPPPTTAAILGDDGPVVAAGIDEVPGDLAPRLALIGWDSLGAWYVYLLLRPVDRAAAATIRDGWDGDGALFARDRSTGAVGVLWASAWESQNVAALARTALEALHDDAEPVVIEQRGTLVVLARNFDPAITRQLVEAAFAGEPGKPTPAEPRPPRSLARIAHDPTIGCLR